MPQNSIRTRREPDTRENPLVVHSHLRWDFVWQRPQQLLSRFARNAPVLFIEEPVYLDDITSNRLDLTKPHQNVIRAVPLLRGILRGDYDASVNATRELAIIETGPHGSLDGMFSNPVQWFYTPMPAPAMLGAFNEIGVVYDCMDELSQFRNAPPDLIRREMLLLSNADVVFTGGYKLFKSKSRHHSSVHFFGCGVDVQHFSKARAAETEVPLDAQFSSPVAGYFGVIDERLDYDLLRSLAEQHPELTIVMVGPTAKVDPAELPNASNIHWLGQRTYDELPRYVKGFDVCMMPFALNEATEYINPTKTLEYMAAGKPIVSTAVPDVVHNFTPIVSVARTHDEFIAQTMKRASTVDGKRIADGIAMAANSSWESIVAKMRSLIRDSVDSASTIDRVIATETVRSAEAEMPSA